MLLAEFALWGWVQDHQYLPQLLHSVQEKSSYQQSLQTGCCAGSGSCGMLPYLLDILSPAVASPCTTQQVPVLLLAMLWVGTRGDCHYLTAEHFSSL